MKFKFKFQKLLDHRRALENVARREWLEAKAAVDKARAELQDMYAQIDAARMRASQIEKEGGARGGELVQIDEFISGQYIRIERHRAAMRPLIEEEERKHENLVAAARERKTIEKLLERHYEDFRLKRKKQELKSIDDLVVMRFRHAEDDL